MKTTAQSIARKARKERLAQERRERWAARAADMKRKRELTVTVRGVRVKQSKFKALRKELLSELKSLAKALESTKTKLQARFAEVEALAKRFSDLSDTYSLNITEEDFDIQSQLDVVSSAIEEVTEAKS
jgi:chromosome segregation ATPase